MDYGAQLLYAIYSTALGWIGNKHSFLVGRFREFQPYFPGLIFPSRLEFLDIILPNLYVPTS